jgi:hypothetical protein
MTEKSIDLRLVFTKTDSGTLEVTERKLGLSQTARRVLILIDGQRRLSDLAGMARPNELVKVIEELQTSRVLPKAPMLKTFALEISSLRSWWQS